MNEWPEYYNESTIIFIHFYSVSLSISHSEVLPTTALILCRNKHAEALRKLRVKDLPKVLTWLLEWDSTLRTSGPKAWNPTTGLPCPTQNGLTMRLLHKLIIQQQHGKSFTRSCHSASACLFRHSINLFNAYIYIYIISYYHTPFKMPLTIDQGSYRYESILQALNRPTLTTTHQ